MSFDFLLGIGGGILLTVACLSPVLLRAYRAHVKDREIQLSERVNGMVKSILDARDAEDPDLRKLKAGRPTRKQDALSAALWQYTDMIRQAEKFRDTLEYIKLGGHPDDDPAKVIRTLDAEKGKNA